MMKLLSLACCKCKKCPLFLSLLGVIQMFSHTIDEEAHRHTWKHSLDYSCLLLSDRLKKQTLSYKENIKYETARHLSIEDTITFQLVFWNGKIKESV